LTSEALRLIEPFNPRLVIHCGDIGSEDVVSLFTGWPAHFVLGNVDDDERGLRRAIEVAGHTFHGRFGELELCGKRIAFLHGDDSERFRAAIRSGDWDLVCYGHTHRAKQEFVDRTLVLNPGAVYRASPHSVAIVELPSLGVVPLEF
jgi:putative phosphoesterase